MAERKNEARWLDKYQRWQINVQKDGRRKTFYSSKTGTKGKIEAEKQADHWLREGCEQPNIRFAKLYEQFLAEKELLKGKSSSDLRKHQYIGSCYLLPMLGTKKVQNITLGDWQECINKAYKHSQLKSKPLSAKSLKNIRASMTAVAAYAARHNIPLIRPEYIQIPKSAPIGERTILTPEDIRSLFSPDAEKNGFWYIHFVRFILVCGLRPGEAAGLTRSDIQNNLLTIRRSINNQNEITDCKNTNARRSQYLSDTAQHILQQQQQMLKQNNIVSPWIFPDPTGDMASPHYIYKRWKQFCHHTGITPCSLYELRHTMVSITKNYLPEHLLKMTVGHSTTMDTYGIYAHQFGNDLQIAASAMDNAFANLLQKERSQG